MIKRLLKIIAALVMGSGVGCGIFVFSVINAGKQAIFQSVADIPEPTVVIVFGAGLNRDGSPSGVLADRLQVAADIYRAGKATAILVSGDNRFKSYNEPQAMHDSLVHDFNIPNSAITIDFAGRRTYDTCRRAHDLWGVDHAILVTQGFHLYRALWTCSHLGIQSSGLSASLHDYVKSPLFKLRELGAMLKACYDVYIVTPEYVKGDPSPLKL